MLLLQRRVGESIFIGDDIKITVLDASHRQVRLGIQAPRDVGVHREEIYQRIQLEKAGQGGGNHEGGGNRADGNRNAASGNHHAPADNDYRHSDSGNEQIPRISNKRDQVKIRAAHPFRRKMQTHRDS